MAEIQKTLKIDVDELRIMIEHKHNVTIEKISCSYRGIKCLIK